MVSSTPEVEWDDEQRQHLLDLAAVRADTCGGCGGSLHETTDPANFRWSVPKPAYCYSCDALDSERERSEDAEKKKAGGGRRAFAVKWRRPINNRPVQA